MRRNPLERAVRQRIVRSRYWNEECQNLTAATILDEAVKLTAVAGTAYSSWKPQPFLCLLNKLLVLKPEPEIVDFYLNEAGREFKYIRALAAFYIRLTCSPVEVYTKLDPHLADYRKLRVRTTKGARLTYMDEFIDDLMKKSRVCSTSLTRLPPEWLLDEQGRLPNSWREIKEARESKVVDLMEDDSDDESAKESAICNWAIRQHDKVRIKGCGV